MVLVPECIVCLQPYDEAVHVPRLLACGHSFCEVCLKQLQCSATSSTGALILCPECSHRTRLPAGGSERSLPKNIELVRLLPSLIREPADEPTLCTATGSTAADENAGLVEINLDWTIGEFQEPPESPTLGCVAPVEIRGSNARLSVRRSVRRVELGDELPACAALSIGESLVSTSDDYTFTNHEDGNLCVLDGEGLLRWDAETRGEGRGDVMVLKDGNLVLFDTEGSGRPVWASMSQTNVAGPFSLIMQDDGNLVIYGSNHVPTWATWSDTSSGLFIEAAGNAELPSGVSWLQTCDTLVSRDRKYTFVNQGDGNLCIYNRQGKATWSSGTFNKGAGNLYMQGDGNLVLYNTDGDVSSPGGPIWSSGTFGRGIGPYKLVMQDDGQLVIYDDRHSRTWTSNAAAVRGSSVRPDHELLANGTMHSDEGLLSEAEEYLFINQEDGNLVTYTKDGKATWASNTGPGGLSGGSLKLLTDGNLVLFDTKGSGKPFWASMSQGASRSSGRLKLVMQDDGNLVIYRNSVATWATRTLDRTSGRFTSYAGGNEMPSGVTWLGTFEMLVSRNKVYKFVNQGDGNLCIYKRNSKVQWASGTYSRGTGGGNLYMQRDGNLVLYNTDGEGAPMWSSGTFGRGRAPYRLVMQDDGNLVIYDTHHKAIWATGTASW